jgi:hypothetical protein
MTTLRFLTAASLSIVVAACAVEKSSTPLAPTVAGPIAGVNITAPKTLEPASGAQIAGDKQPLTLLLENASSSGQRPLTYLFEVATEPGFNNRVFAQDNVPPGDNGRTSLRMPANLAMGKVYYWRAKAVDGANESAYSNPADFNVYTPVAFDKPSLVSPINNASVSSQRPIFAFSNAPRQGTPLTVSYVIEISSDSAFASKVAVWQLDEAPGPQQTFPSAADLPGGVQLYWHVRAFESPVIGPWSDAQSFRTPAPPQPAPSPAPGGPAPGKTCSSETQPFNVVQCRRAQYGAHMSPDQVVQFEKAVAGDLNKSSIGGGPYGLLRKSNGASCGGYACDIICTGQGSGQKQWDILGDSDGAQTPAWNGPKSGGDIRVDSCDVP